MAKGLQKHQERLDALNALGRHLARRAGSKCELCEAAGVRLNPFEVPPVPADEPELERTLLLCVRCQDGAKGGHLAKGEWLFLQGSAWSDFPPVQVTAVRILRRLDDSGEAWASELLDSLYLGEEVQAWL